MAARKPAVKKPAKKTSSEKTTQQQNGRTAEFDQRVLRMLGPKTEKAVSDIALALEVDNSFVRRSVKRLAATKSVALRKEGVSIYAKRV